ncbi:MAG: SufD family Fe-S cluster assembly protein [Erysipelotrichaceae bacterium]|jgi:Fe-S cluster assembly protein SufD|nr:SufD family Fe-S cluster assembly protein [Erysipelotrichaceae bacterium]
MSELLDRDTQLVVSRDGFYHYEVQSQDTLTLHLCLEEGVSVSGLLDLAGAAGEVNLQVALAKEAQCSLLVLNQSQKPLTVFEEVCLKKKAVYEISYGEFAAAKGKRVSAYHLSEEGAALNLHTAILCGHEADITQIAYQNAPATEAQLSTYGIVVEEGKLSAAITGKIVKGASGSQCQQKTKILTLGDRAGAKVIPQLLIDENEVQASHGLSIGQLEEASLYYLQSRGLSESEALRLVALGYLKPILHSLKESKLQAHLEALLQKKVSELWT